MSGSRGLQKVRSLQNSAAALTGARRQYDLVRQSRSTAAGDSSPFRRMSEPLCEGRGVLQCAKAIPDRVFGQVDVHVPRKSALFEPIKNVHSGVVERQRHLLWKVPVDLENWAHFAIENEKGTLVNGTTSRSVLAAICTRYWRMLG
jgi:hypothetical protein